MNEDIEKIIKYFINDAWFTIFNAEECNDEPYKLLNPIEVNEIMDYITKLQNNWNELKEIEKEHQKINGELREENADLREKIILLQASEPMLELTKYYGERDKLKEVIEKIRKTLKLERKTALSLNKAYTVSVIDSVLQILDKGESNE